MYNKILFLDMDGVINNSTKNDLICLPMTNKYDKDCGSTLWGASNIQPFLSLMKWCYNKGISIVISSTWRVTMTTELFNKYLNRYFGRNDLTIVVGLTNVCQYPYMHRGKEIRDYLAKHTEIDKYLCIDDSVEDILENVPSEKVYKVNGDIGLTKKDIKNIKNIWRNNYEKP